ncbi:hypothetical protein EHE19_006715 [Ruminiclostridium herbifermentans]|uniref:Fibronectin type-III domain-containing protein n=1 Tax=Ruminiclostridium herbifermentans TaxID=2488810 RepID=A0A4U7JCQ1_9FIRM|nr:cellulose binding domain-containing protein [Ruminiclostridium herbifermentans]QNU68119.1 hypothetical protein EHE19_006715 [Ruminiclostridium herbifermentans]
MLKKVVSIILICLIIISTAVPTYADNNNWVRCYVNDDGKVQIDWSVSQGIKELRITRSGETFKSYTLNVPYSGNLIFTETEEGTFKYEVSIYGYFLWSDILLAKTEQSLYVKGTGKPVIWLDFINTYNFNQDPNFNYSSVPRIYNWVNIKNLGTTDLELSKLLIRYFYTIDGEPSIVEDTFPNNGQQKAEESDGKLNPMEPYYEYPVGRNNIQAKDSIRMNFLKIPFDVTDENNTIVADYICETYFEQTTEKINTAYFLRLQPAFDKKNMTNPEYGSIRHYNLLNDFSFNNNQNIAVYYDGVKIWGIDPTIRAPKNLKGEYINYKVELVWDDCPGATSYIVYRSESRDGEYKRIGVTFDKTNYTDTDVELPNQSVNKKYYYKVVAKYDKLYSDDSNIAEVEVSELKAPTNLTAYVIGKNVKLEWNESLGAAKYNVYRSESENGYYSKIKSDVIETNFIDYNAEPQGLKKTYYYKVKAVIENNGKTIESEFSNFASASIINLPVPSNLTATLVNSKDVKLEWDTTIGAVEYIVYRSDSEYGIYIDIGTVSDGNTFVDNSINLVHNFKNYYYKISAKYNIDGSDIYSDKSKSASVRMPRKKLEPPENFEAENYEGTKALLNWSPSEGARYYIIYRSEYPDRDDKFESITDEPIAAFNDNGEPVTSFLDDTIPPVSDSVGKNFYYRMVAAYDKDDTSDASDTVSVMITMHIGGNNEDWSWECGVINTTSRSADFVLGTYIPVWFKITLNKDSGPLTISLDKDLITHIDVANDNTYRLKTDIVSEKDSKNGIKPKLISSKLKEYSDKSKNRKDINAIDINSYVTISSKNQILIDRNFRKDDEITVQFVIKTSADNQVITDGINRYYGDIYNMKFIIKKDNPDDPNKPIIHEAVNSSGDMLNIKILKPNKLQ